MNTRGARRRWIPVAALLAPVLVVQGFRAVSGWHVQTSSASGPRPADLPVPAPQPAPLQITPDMKRAADWITSRGPIRVGRSPMDHVPGIKPIAVPAKPDPEPVLPNAVTPPNRPETKLVLSAIIGGKTSNMASINGRIYRLGDDVEPGWTIIAIHPRRMVVVLSGPEGQVVELSRSGLDER
jgi:hypothetical protein